MSYTEIQKKGKNSYYYRVKSIKRKGKVMKKKVYLGENMNKRELKNAEKEADLVLNKSLNTLFSQEQKRELEKIKSNFQKSPRQTFENRYEVFLSKFTYNSNAIEGNTIDLKETSYILFENRTPQGRSLREVNEVLNHKEAFDFMLSYKQRLNKKFICQIQTRIIKNTLRKDLENQIGKYRLVQVYIRGVDFIPSAVKEIPMEMRSLIRWYNQNQNKVHPLILAAHFHIAFEAIHPFVDGNGRTGRILLNFILNQNGFPMLNIPNKRKLEYYSCLEQAQIRNNLKPFVDFLYSLFITEEKYI